MCSDRVIYLFSFGCYQSPRLFMTSARFTRHIDLYIGRKTCSSVHESLCICIIERILQVAIIQQTYTGNERRPFFGS